MTSTGGSCAAPGAGVGGVAAFGAGVGVGVVSFCGGGVGVVGWACCAATGTVEANIATASTVLPNALFAI